MNCRNNTGSSATTNPSSSTWHRRRRRVGGYASYSCLLLAAMVQNWAIRSSAASAAAPGQHSSGAGASVGTTAAAPPLAPLWLGLRSAWSTYTGHPQGGRHQPFRVTSRTATTPSAPLFTPFATVDDGNNDPESESNLLQQAAFPLMSWRSSHPDDPPSTLHEAQYAYLQRQQHSINGGNLPIDELEWLEESSRSAVHHGGAVPCALSVRHQPGSQTSAASSKRTSRANNKRRSGRHPTTLSVSVAAASAAMSPAVVALRPLAFWENMVAGAISRSIAQTVMHPANTLKTMLQTNPTASAIELLRLKHFRRLTRGAGANFLLSVPHGAVNFAVLELVRKQLSVLVEATPALADRADKIGPGLDFLSSAISTITCSIVSTPQMVVSDNIMAGNYPNLVRAVQGLAEQRGLAAFYTGWWPGLVGKIPSYALTWTFFQQLKEARDKLTGRPATDIENTIMGCIASGTTVCIMIPLDTIKTRLVTQSAASTAGKVAYKGIVDCGVRVVREEGARALYRGLTPRLVSVVPMIGIQFGVYEFMRRALVERTLVEQQQQQQKSLLRRTRDVEREASAPSPRSPSSSGERHRQRPREAALPSPADGDSYGSSEALQEAAMEVAASPEVPFPAPRFLKRIQRKTSLLQEKRPRTVR